MPDGAPCFHGPTSVGATRAGGGGHYRALSAVPVNRVWSAGGAGWSPAVCAQLRGWCKCVVSLLDPGKLK